MLRTKWSTVFLAEFVASSFAKSERKNGYVSAVTVDHSSVWEDLWNWKFSSN